MSCGTCTMCCKLLGVEELSKPAGQWCDRCDPKAGCRAYDNRPRTCRGFECVWLQTQRGAAGSTPLPQGLRPDRSRVVIDVTTDGRGLVFHVDPSRPDAHSSSLLQPIVDAVAKDGKAIFIVCGERRSVIGAAAAVARATRAAEAP